MNGPVPAADWIQGSAMTPLETIMWRAEVDVMLKSTIVALEILDGAPEWSDVVAAHERALERVPRLRHRVVEPTGLAPPRWSDDPQFDLHFHLRRSRLPAEATWQDLFSAAEQVAMSPFDRSRPPWESVLYEGLPDGKAALLLKLHHASTDGVGIVQLLSVLHSEDQGAGEEAVLPGQALFDVRRMGNAVRGFATAPVPALRRGLRYGLSFQRVMAPPTAPPSPLLAQRSTNWRFAAIEVDFAALKAAAKVADGSLNDAYIAGLLGGYRRYHEAMGYPVDEIPMSIPVSTRREGDPAGGNRFTTAKLSGPVGVVDARARISAIKQLVRSAREEPALDSLSVLAPMLALLPGTAIAQIAGGIAKGNDLQASNVPGSREAAYFAGRLVERLYPFAPLPGCPAMITLVSHGDTCCIGINYDAAAITEAELFLDSLVAGFEEVLTLADGGAKNVRRKR